MLSIKDRYEKYKKEEDNLHYIKKENFTKKMSFFTSLIFIIANFSLTPLFILLCQIVFFAEGVGAGIDHIWTTILSIFGGMILIAMTIFLLYEWFCGTSYFSWESDVANKIKEGYEVYYQKKILLLGQKKREEFFKFYELYTTDADFKEQYDNQMLSRNEKDKKEFLEKLEDR